MTRGADTPHGAARRVAFVTLPGIDARTHDAMEALLADTAAALRAYERLTSRGLEGEPEMQAVVLRDRAANTPALQGCCAVVAGAVADTDGTAERALDELSRTMSRIDPAPRLYTVLACPGRDAAPARTLVERTGARAREQDLPWGGGIAIACAEALPRLMRSPRMGMFRRPLAEAADRLVAALRMGCGLDELDTLLSAPARDAANGGKTRADAVIEVGPPRCARFFARRS